MLRRLFMMVLVLLLASCAWVQRIKESLPAPLQNISMPKISMPNFFGAPGNATRLKAPADWGELTRDVAFRISQRTTQLKELNQRLIYVSEPAQPTPFSLVLRQYLQTNLSDMGLVVSQKKGEGVLVLDTEVQSVRMDSGLQVVVTAMLGNGNRYYFRATEAYAVNQPDAALYDLSMKVAPTAPPPAPPPIPVKRIGVTGDN